MSDQFDLDKLPKYQASASFEDRLFADAISVMEPALAPATPQSKSAPIWMSFAMAASLAVGVWLGFGQLDVMQDSLAGLGIAGTSTATTDLGIDAYDETLLALN